MDKILIVEDELIVARDIRKTLERNGHKVAGVAQSVEKALLMVKEFSPWLVLVDIILKGTLTGIDLATQLNKDGIAFIYLSANSNQPTLEAAKITNPYGFIVKPFREKDLLVTIDIARYRHDSNKNIAGHQFSKATDEREHTIINTTPVYKNIIGKSAAMINVFNLVQQVAGFDTSVLLLGESGTGKEGVARCIFEQSKRSTKPFIKVNCSAIPVNLMEAEFFGYEKGAFTGASERKAGKFELATGGTMLLDEIGEMPIDMQVKLLRVLQEKEIQRLGSTVTIKADVRIIAATSRNLEKEVAEGRFRLDLYYRLYVFPIVLPALRERKEDIPLLASHFINKISGTTGRDISGISHDALDKLVAYNWPGNVRELEHTIERSILITNGNIINEIRLPVTVSESESGTAERTATHSLEENEREYIVATLKKTNGKIRGPGGAAELLKIPPTTLHSKMKKLGIIKTIN
ncbi:MAG: sigma-54 dependent transcriptional regulator [Ferruginibacter sp.]